jgi:hypothetical protein
MKMKLLYFSQKSNNRLCILFCTMSMLLGGLIYILFRIAEPAFFKWIPSDVLDGWFNFARGISLGLRYFLPAWIIYSLPNGLWAFSYALIITHIWWHRESGLKYFWLSCILFVVTGFEILQYAGIIPGTFCVQDLAMGITGLITGIIVGIITTKPNCHEKAFE